MHYIKDQDYQEYQDPARKFKNFLWVYKIVYNIKMN